MSAKLTSLLKAVQDDLPITVRAERWLIDNADPVYSEKAIQFSDDFLRGKVGGHRNRKPAFRASGLGKCARQRIFARLGVTQVSQQFSSAQANTFATGNFFHRKWQMGGLTEGWLTEAEIPLYSETWDMGGTMDGRVYDGSLFEFKTINSRGYKWVSQTKKPNEEHVKQLAGYKLLDPTLTAASILYENKENGEWREMRVYFTDEVMEPAQAELLQLHRAMKNHELPVIRDDCRMRTGSTYRQCPFRESCLKTKSWPVKETP